jgi:hypothetical protein
MTAMPEQVQQAAKQRTATMIKCAGLGLALGGGLGVAIGSIAIGVAVGMVLGIAGGAIFVRSRPEA